MSESEEKLKKEGTTLTIDYLKDLLVQGSNLVQESQGENGVLTKSIHWLKLMVVISPLAMESVLSKIRGILSDAQGWEQQYKDAVEQK